MENSHYSIPISNYNENISPNPDLYKIVTFSLMGSLPQVREHVQMAFPQDTGLLFLIHQNEQVGKKGVLS